MNLKRKIKAGLAGLLLGISACSNPQGFRVRDYKVDSNLSDYHSSLIGVGREGIECTNKYLEFKQIVACSVPNYSLSLRPMQQRKEKEMLPLGSNKENIEKRKILMERIIQHLKDNSLSNYNQNGFVIVGRDLFDKTGKPLYFWDKKAIFPIEIRTPDGTIFSFPE